VSVLLLLLALVLFRPASPASAQDLSPLWPNADEIEHFLKRAKVVEKKKIGSGVTKPEKVTLEMDGVTRNAVFKKVEQSYDSWRFEVAAYELDKLLGLGRVPPTVERSIGGRKGCLQLWVDGTTLANFQGTPSDRDLWCLQVSMMWLFDDLIANIDRHMNNAIVTADYRLAFIDNSKTFRHHDTLLNDLNRGATGTHARYWLVPYEKDRQSYPTRYSPRIIERLRTLTEKEIKRAISPHVYGQNVDRVLERRDLILKRLDELAAAGTDRAAPPRDEYARTVRLR
jgi:hypothetical protein